MICLGGDVIVPEPGYYRVDINSSEVQRCLNPEACLGGVNDKLHINHNGFCKPPFAGQLCS